MFLCKNDNIYIGCSGWSYKEWREIFYPKDLPIKEYLAYYSRSFNTVEINSTFYRLPTEKTVKSWYTQTPPNFKYSLKASRILTHIKRFEDIREPLKYFYGLGDFLAEKMRCFLFQFPGTFAFTPKKLELIISHLDEKRLNVVEFRHQSWWNEAVFRAFDAANITFCTVSGLSVPEDLIITGKTAYIRYHGDPTYSISYGPSVISEWSNKIRNASPNTTWIYFNNTRFGAAVEDALCMENFLHLQN